MNIFYLSGNPKKAAEYHCDSHVVKMPVESVQMLVTSRILNKDLKLQDVIDHAESMSEKYSHPTLDLEYPVYSELFKTHFTPTMRNHPCTLWVRECYKGFGYLESLLKCLGEEYTKRYGKTHKSILFYESLPPAKIKFKRRRAKPVPLAVGKCVRYPNQPVRTYREFYKIDKKRFAKWSYTETPYWW